MINTEAFGKNDIRGIYGETVTEELFYETGKAYVLYMREKTEKENVILSVIRDVRLHSESLAKALIKGIIEAGGTVLDLGMGPTPFGYFSGFANTDFGTPDGALIITASHNPSEYNGLKMTCMNHSLGADDIKELKALTEKVACGEIKIDATPGNEIEYDILPDYVNKMKEIFSEKFDNLTVVTDCANATAGIIAPKLYKMLGCKVEELYTEPDGRFPNHHPNPSVESTLDALKAKVKECKADVGIAFDGDSDRIGVVDSDGNALTGDKLLLIYASEIIPECLKKGEKPSIVSEVKCSQVLYDSLENAGANAIMCKTGHGYIKSEMKKSSAVLAGEMSGHMFFNDRYFGFDDAIYAGCRIIEIISHKKRKNPEFKLSDLLKPFEAVTTGPEVRFPCANELKKPVLARLSKVIEENPMMFGDEIKDIITIDGLRIVFDGGFALIRQSNTEPVFTLRFEAKTPELCTQYTDSMLKELERICEREKALTTKA